MAIDTLKGFTIIIPTFNRAELLKIALDSIQRIEVPDGWDVETLVVDNNSTDSTSEVVEQYATYASIPVRCITERKQGLNYARNRGLAAANYDHLVYLDDDMTIAPSWLKGYVETFEQFAPHAIVGPVDPVFEESPAEWVTSRMLDSVNSSYSQKGDKAFILSPKEAHEIPGCNFCVLKPVAEAVGGFHPALDRSGSGMLAGGDWEFGERLARGGYRTAYSPRCRINHLISRKKLSRDGLRARWRGLGATRRTLESLRGESPSLGRRLRLFIRMIRFFSRMVGFRSIGDSGSAFRWELESQNLQGYLFGVSRGLGVRRKDKIAKPSAALPT